LPLCQYLRLTFYLVGLDILEPHLDRFLALY
jgi:hypothetical protein